MLDRRIPFFGICFGNQILGRALGLRTYKLKFGHRGINQPVQDAATGTILVTSQNHGFAVDAVAGEDLPTPYGTVRVGFSSLNDGVVEGLTCQDVPAFSVQFHPEAAAGPHDAAYLFDRFADLMRDDDRRRTRAQRGPEVGGAEQSGTAVGKATAKRTEPQPEISPAAAERD